jgi:hypothetical protein
MGIPTKFSRRLSEQAGCDFCGAVFFSYCKIINFLYNARASWEGRDMETGRLDNK